MSIVKMKRLRLLGLRSDRDQLFRLLQKQGCVEINEPVIDPDDPDWAALVRPDGRGLATAKEQNTLLNNALSTLKKYATAKEGLFLKRQTLSEAELFDDAAYAAGLETARAILDGERNISLMTSEQGKLQSQLAALAPWLSLDVPLDLAGSKSAALVFGTIPAKADYAAMEAAVSAACEMSQLFHASADQDLHYFLLVCHVSTEDACIEAMRPSVFPGQTSGAGQAPRRKTRVCWTTRSRRWTKSSLKPKSTLPPLLPSAAVCAAVWTAPPRISHGKKP